MILISSKSKNIHEDILDGVAFHESGVVCYSNGLEQFKKEGGLCSELVQGKFFIKYNENGNTIIRADEDGKELIFYYAKNEFWCVSTSFLGMIHLLKEHNIPLTTSRIECAKFFVNTSLFEQPYNSKLPIKEIKLLDAKNEIILSHNQFSIVERKNTKIAGKSKFFDLVNDFISESRAIISGLVNNFDVNLELSGGNDSRIILGLALPYKD